MAVLGRYQQQVQRQIATPGAAPVAQSTGLQSLGAGLTNIATALNAEADREARDYTLDQKNKIQVEYANYEQELSSTATSGKEYLEGVVSFFEKKKAAGTEGAPSTRASKSFNEYINDISSKAETNAVNTAATINAENSARVVKDAIDIARNNTFLNPLMYEQSKQDAHEAVMNSDLPENKKGAALKEIDASLKRSRTLGEIRGDPFASVIKLSQGDMGLTPEVHEQMFGQAIAAKSRQQKEMLAKQAQIDKEVKAMESAIQSATAKDGDELLATNNLSFDWISQNRDNLSDSDYRYFLTRAAGAGGKGITDPQAFTQLYTAAGEGVDVRGEARLHYTNGTLTQSDYTSIVSRYESNDELPTAYKQGERFLSSSFKPSELNPAVGSQLRYANVMDEWNQWYESNPNPTVGESMEQARQIEQRYRTIELQESTATFLTGPAPVYLDGGRTLFSTGKATSENIQNTRVKTFEAYSRGDLTEEEFKREVDLIESWADIFNITVGE